MSRKLLKQIKKFPLKTIKLKEGNIMHALKKKDLKNWNFKEAYFSKIKPGKVKAWKFHLKMSLNLIVPRGRVKFVFYSKSDNNFRIIEIGEKKYSRLTVPPKIWFGFKGIGKYESIILNLTNIHHNPKGILRRKKNEIKFDW